MGLEAPRRVVGVLLFLSAVLWAGEQPNNEARANSARVKAHAYKRMQFFWEQRAYPLNRIPPGANQRALAQRETSHRFAAQRNSTASAMQAAASEGQWSELGPRPLTTSYTWGEVGGRASALAIDPRDNDVVYMGAADGGIWKTVNGGAQWTPLSDFAPSLSVGAIAIAPSEPDTIYVGTGEGNFAFDSYYGAGILKSVDGGATWVNHVGPFGPPMTAATYSQVTYYGSAHIGAIAVKRDNANHVLAGAVFPVAATSGIYLSQDGGATWRQTLGGDAGNEIYFDPQNVNVVYAALGGIGTTAAGVYKSVDAGQTWTRLGVLAGFALPKSTNVGRVALAVAPTNAALMYAGIEDANTGNLMGLYKTSDGGTTWAKQILSGGVQNYCGPQCWYDNVIAISPINANVVYLGGSASAGLYRTTDGGASWSAVAVSSSGTVHVDHHALKFTADGTKLYDGNDGGVWSTTTPSGTLNWTNLNHTLGTLQFYPGISVRTPDTAIYGGMQDNGTARYDGAMWSQVACGDGGFTAVNPSDPNTVYAACQYAQVMKSVDGGRTFSVADSGLSTSGDRVQFISPLAMDARQPDVLYFGTYRVWQTKDGGGTWSPISSDLTGSTDRFVSAIAVAPSNSNVVYAGTSNGRIVRTPDALAVMPAWTTSGAGLPTRYVTSVVVDPTNPATAYATFSGFTFGIDTYGHVFKTTNSGTSWVDISGDLPNTPVNDLVIDTQVAETLLVATDVGVFRTSDGGATWTPVGSGLPNSAVMSIKLHAATRTLLAATHGRGIWQLPVPLPLPTLAPAALDFGSVNAGSSSAPQSVTLSNPTMSPLGVTSASSNSSEFSITNHCGATLAANSSCAIDVTFAPSGTGIRSGTLTVVTSDSGSPRYVALTGQGTAVGVPQFSLSATTLSFDARPVGTSSGAQGIFVRNTGVLPVAVSRIFVATGASSFVQYNDCPATLAIASSCTIRVIFRPVATGAATGTITIESNAAGSPPTVALTGSGVAAVEKPHAPVPRGTIVTGGGRPAPAIGVTTRASTPTRATSTKVVAKIAAVVPAATDADRKKKPASVKQAPRRVLPKRLSTR